MSSRTPPISSSSVSALLLDATSSPTRCRHPPASSSSSSRVMVPTSIARNFHGPYRSQPRRRQRVSRLYNTDSGTRSEDHSKQLSDEGRDDEGLGRKFLRRSTEALDSMKITSGESGDGEKQHHQTFFSPVIVGDFQVEDSSASSGGGSGRLSLMGRNIFSPQDDNDDGKKNKKKEKSKGEKVDDEDGGVMGAIRGWLGRKDSKEQEHNRKDNGWFGRKDNKKEEQKQKDNGGWFGRKDSEQEEQKRKAAARAREIERRKKSIEQSKSLALQQQQRKKQAQQKLKQAQAKSVAVNKVKQQQQRQVSKKAAATTQAKAKSPVKRSATAPTPKRKDKEEAQPQLTERLQQMLSLNANAQEKPEKKEGYNPFAAVQKMFSNARILTKNNAIRKEQWVTVFPKTRIMPGEMVPVTVAGIDLLVVASKNTRKLHCIANQCPHLGTPLEVGTLERRPIESSSPTGTASTSTSSSTTSSSSSSQIKTPSPPSFFTETDISGLLTQDGCEDCIVCPLHRTAFALESGEVRGEWCPYPPGLGPMVGAVKRRTNAAVFDVRTKGKNVQVRINTPLDWQENKDKK